MASPTAGRNDPNAHLTDEVRAGIEACLAREAALRVPMFTQKFKRLFWTLNGPLSTSIFVLNESRDVDGPREPYFHQTLDGTSWHPVSEAPLTEPRISSVAFELDVLCRWEDDWLEHHIHESEDDPDLQSCCGEPRPPPPPPPLIIRPTGDRDYLTVHDYVSAVHPWIMERRGDILAAMDVWDGPLPPQTRLVMSYGSPDNGSIEEEERYIESKRFMRDRGPMMFGQGPLPAEALGQIADGNAGAWRDGGRGHPLDPAPNTEFRVPLNREPEPGSGGPWPWPGAFLDSHQH